MSSGGSGGSAALTHPPPPPPPQEDDEEVEHIPSPYLVESQTLAASRAPTKRIVILNDSETDSDDGASSSLARPTNWRQRSTDSDKIELNPDAASSDSDDGGKGDDSPSTAAAADVSGGGHSSDDEHSQPTSSSAAKPLPPPPPPSTIPVPGPPPPIDDNTIPPPPDDELAPDYIPPPPPAAGAADSTSATAAAAAANERARAKRKRARKRLNANAAATGLPSLGGAAPGAANGTAAAGSAPPPPPPPIGRIRTLNQFSYVCASQLASSATPVPVRVPDFDHSYLFNSVGKKVCRQLKAANINQYVMTGGGGSGASGVDLASVSGSSTSGFTMLHTAALSCDLDLAIHCMRCGADINRLSFNGETAVQLALLSASVVANSKTKTTATKAGSSASAAKGDMKSSHSAIAALTASKHSAEANERRLSLVSYLLDCGAYQSIHNKNANNGQTALHAALAIVATAPPPPPPPTTTTSPARDAIITHALACAELLLSFGADPSAADFTGATPIDLISVATDRALFVKLFAAHKSRPRPSAASKLVKRCWCASGKEHGLCHGATSAAASAAGLLLPVVPDWLDCPCGNASTDGSGAAADTKTAGAQKKYRSYANAANQKGWCIEKVTRNLYAK